MSSPGRPLTVVIDARLPADGSAGGVAWVTEGLLRALAALGDGAEHYRVLAPPGQAERLGALGGGIEVIAHRPPVWRSARGAVRRWLLRAPRVQGLMDAACDRLPRRGGALETARDPVLEGLDCDLIHFPTQRFRPSSRPSVYNPHDLQHLHFPDFFTPRDVTRRERLYRAGCAGARAVAVSSSWVKRDLVTHYGLSPDKVRVIPWGIDPNPGVDVAADRDALARRLGSLLQAPFALYPAATWEHKNHSRLLEALAYLRDTQGLRLNVVCCGHRTGFYPRIQRRVESLRLGDQVAFPGVLPAGELDCAYRQALCVVVPSLFEASSALLREAWRWRRPVACAAVTSLPEQAGGSALLFEPTDPQAIAGALHRLATDPGLRADLVERGARRIARFPWEHTARAYRALYRTVAGRPLTTDEIDLLNHDWMTAP